MMPATLVCGIIVTSIGSLYAMDTEITPLVKNDEHELVIVTLDDSITLDQAYKNGLRANTQGYLIYTDKNLISCAGLSLYKDKLHLDTLTHLDLKRNKLTEFHAEFLSAMPNLVHLDLSDNEISVGCNPIPSHQHLKTAYLHNNKLTFFPLAPFLTNVPVKQLTLHGNQITNYGILSSHHTTLEELWIDETAPSWTKEAIASYCPNLVAEMCENDTTVQDAHTELKFHQNCRSECGRNTGVGALIGIGTGFCGSIAFGVPCIFIDTCHQAVYTGPLGASIAIPIVLGSAGSGAVAGSLIGLLRACCCVLTPDERRMQKTILKQIAQYPPIIQKLKQRAQEASITEEKT